MGCQFSKGRLLMTSYIFTVVRPPRTLSVLEQARLLKVTGEHRAGFRDHVIIATALGTALREHEIAGLDVGDILHSDDRVRRRFSLRIFKRSSKEPVDQDVFLPDSTWYKLTKFVSWKRAQGESLAPDAPLFVSRRGQRIATRTLRHMFRLWQTRAGFDRNFGLHATRHTSLSNLYRATRDIRLVQRVARHKSIETTSIYAAPSDEDIFRAVAELPC
jgi:site-specific recombinase XerC